MWKPTLLRTDRELNMGQEVWSQLTDVVRIVTAEDARQTTLIRHAPTADLIYTCYAPISADVIGAAGRLRGIVKYGVGVDNIDLDAATARGIPVAHCPDYGTETVADHAFALLAGVARRITTIDRDIREQGWLWPEPRRCGVDLAGKTLGLIGFGRIGKAMGRRGGGFGMRRLVYDPYVPQTTHGWDDLEFATFERVIEESDFLSLHCVLTPETRHIVGEDELRRMKNSAILIDVSRGALIDEQALVSALAHRQIRGVGLDVFSEEPLSANHPLFDFDNVILTPHLAFYTEEAHQRLEHECLEAVRSILDGRLPKNVKNMQVACL